MTEATNMREADYVNYGSVQSMFEGNRRDYGIYNFSDYENGWADVFEDEF